MSFAMFTVVLIAFATFCYTMLSAIGMGLRYLARSWLPIGRDRGTTAI